ncbi:hypothetical protein FVE85_2886 [Porphyridium purpureum]|uniref:Elongin-A n=1 Tax=Porphyridium purpureum TaxID=35688 RepID=A0A5J4YTT2_PORPP|nr:hypothetical protein FVE85_2886 [Porphyridium purpureum]|eukprot:POR7313..scf227_4
MARILRDAELFGPSSKGSTLGSKQEVMTESVPPLKERLHVHGKRRMEPASDMQSRPAKAMMRGTSSSRRLPCASETPEKRSSERVPRAVIRSPRTLDETINQFTTAQSMLLTIRRNRSAPRPSSSRNTQRHPVPTLSEFALRAIRQNLSQLDRLGDLPDEFVLPALSGVNMLNLSRIHARNPGRDRLFDVFWARICVSEFGKLNCPSLPERFNTWREFYEYRTQELKDKEEHARKVLRAAQERETAQRERRCVQRISHQDQFRQISSFRPRFENTLRSIRKQIGKRPNLF